MKLKTLDVETIVGRFIEEFAKIVREEDLQAKFAVHGLNLYQGMAIVLDIGLVTSVIGSIIHFAIISSEEKEHIRQRSIRVGNRLENKTASGTSGLNMTNIAASDGATADQLSELYVVASEAEP